MEVQHQAVWLFLMGKTVDYVLTHIGLSMGYREMSQYSSTPIAFFGLLIIIGLLLSMEWIIKRWNLASWWWVPYVVAGMEWLTVPWNLYVISTIY